MPDQFRRSVLTTLMMVHLSALALCCQTYVALSQQPPKAAKVAPTGQPSRGINAAPSSEANVDAAAALVTAGKTEPAIASLSSLIASGNLPPAVMARALYLRGMAYRQQAKPALAISDLTGALWLKSGLNDTDRADATKQRAAAYGDAGLTDQGQAIADATTASTQKRTSASAGGTVTPAAGNGGFLAGLFGGNSTPPASPTAAARPVPTAAASIAVARPVNAAMPPNTQRKAASSAGTFQSRVALVRTRAEADAVLAKLKQHYASALADHGADVGEASFGNMGAFYQVAIGPFRSAAEAQALCTRLKGSTFDCVAVNR